MTIMQLRLQKAQPWAEYVSSPAFRICPVRSLYLQKAARTVQPSDLFFFSTLPFPESV
jgi:hypothetical protein